MEAQNSGNWEKAVPSVMNRILCVDLFFALLLQVEHFTNAILANSTVSMLFALRANAYLQLKKPNAALRCVSSRSGPSFARLMCVATAIRPSSSIPTLPRRSRSEERHTVRLESMALEIFFFFFDDECEAFLFIYFTMHSRISLSLA